MFQCEGENGRAANIKSVCREGKIKKEKVGKWK